MLIEYLSDYAGDELKSSKEERLRASYDEGIWQTQYRGAEAEYRTARRNKPTWRRILSLSTPEEREARQRLDEAERQTNQADARQRQLEHKVQQQAAGVKGEEALASWLSSTLSDDWVMLGGYRNRKGEADLVLVGPSGVWVVEVKNRNAKLHVDGDRWRYEKLDRWGNVVDKGLAVDNSGRTWGQQASEVAQSLVWWLDRNEHRIPVRTAVMLMHHRASLGNIRSPGVDVVSTDPQQLRRAMTDSASVVSPDDRDAIVKLIRRDHLYHNNPQRRRKRS